MKRYTTGEEELDNAFRLRREQKYQKGLAALMKSAELGNHHAMFEIAYSYEQGGWGLEPDRYTNWMEKAAIAGSEIASVYLELEILQGLCLPSPNIVRLYGGIKPYENWDEGYRNIQIYYEKIKDPYAKAYFYLIAFGKIQGRVDEDELIRILTLAANSNCRSKIYGQYLLACHYSYDREVNYGFRVPGDRDIFRTEFFRLIKIPADEGLASAQALYYTERFPADVYVSKEQIQLLRRVCLQGNASLYLYFAKILTDDPQSDLAEAAEWRIKYLTYISRTLTKGEELQGIIGCRMNDMGIPKWRRIFIRGRVNLENLTIDYYVLELSLRLLEARKREYRELYAYGRAFHKDPSLSDKVAWKSNSDMRCCEEVYRYSNQLTEDSIRAFLIIWKRRMLRSHKDPLLIILKMISATRTDPIVWLK